MNKMLLLAVLISFSGLSAQNPEKMGRRELDSLLRAVETADQRVREEVMRLYRHPSPSQDSLVAAVVLQEQVDAENQRVVFGLLDNGGWPEGLSEGANRGIWYVIQHASQEDIRRYLPMIGDAAAKGRIGMADYALTMDRVLMHDKQPQRYGSQTFLVNVDGEQGTLWLWPVEDAVRLDSLRAAVGLQPIADYLMAVEEACGQPVVWDRTKTAAQMAELRVW